jgi:hypothetical protein
MANDTNLTVKPAGAPIINADGTITIQGGAAPSAASSAGSLAGTMTQPKTTTPTPPAPTTPVQPTQPTQPPPQQSTSQQQPTGGPGDPNASSEFSNFMSTMKDKLNANNQLATNRALLMTAMYDRPLTQQELSQLPPETAQLVQSGDKNMLEFQIRLLNDQIQGRTQTLDQAVNYLTTAYQDDLKNAETQKNDMLSVVDKLVAAYGSKAGAALQQLYTPQQLQVLKDQFGITPENLSIPTIAEQKAGIVPTADGTGNVDFSTYDPSNLQYGAQIQSLAAGYGTITDATAAQAIIDANSMGGTTSPVTGDMVMTAAQNYGVDPGQILAVMQQESHFNTDPNATTDISTNNPGSIMGGPNGTQTPYTSVQDGVNGIAQWISDHTTSTSADDTVQSYVTSLQNGTITSLASVPAAHRDAVARALASAPSTTYTPMAMSRFAMTSNRILANYIALPAYQLVAGGSVYLARIEAAKQTPGSVSDQDLLDSLTKLNTGGNAISDAQVSLITNGQTYADWANVMSHKLTTGGVLSTSQRQQISTIAATIYNNYKKLYTPIYDEATGKLKAAGIPEAFWTIPDLNKLSSSVDKEISANASPSTPGTSSSVPAGTVVNYKGKNYTVDASGNMTPQ